MALRHPHSPLRRPSFSYTDLRGFYILASIPLGRGQRRVRLLTFRLTVPFALGRQLSWLQLQRGLVQVGGLSTHRDIYGGFAAEALEQKLRLTSVA
jgi:hypothetical protein